MLMSACVAGNAADSRLVCLLAGWLAGCKRYGSDAKLNSSQSRDFWGFPWQSLDFICYC